MKIKRSLYIGNSSEHNLTVSSLRGPLLDSVLLDPGVEAEAAQEPDQNTDGQGDQLVPHALVPQPAKSISSMEDL